MAESEICASPKVRGSCAPRPSLWAAGIGEVLIEPAALFDPDRSVAAPHAVPLHSRMDRVGTVPPCERS
jgi:hypothetical protein